MAETEDVVYAIAAGNAGVGALVGTRIYPDTVKESATYPCVRFSRISTRRPHAMASDTGDVSSRVQVDALALSVEDAKALRTALRTAFSRYRGTAAGVAVQDILVEDERNDWNDEGKRSIASLDLMVYHKES